jgi:hypothetical protein
MKFTKKYSVVSVYKIPEKKKQVSGVGAFTIIKRALDQVAERVGSIVGVDESKAGTTTFFLKQRPKTRQGRLDWNKEIDRLSTLCGERMSSYFPGIIVGRTGNQLELKQRRFNGSH